MLLTKRKTILAAKFAKYRQLESNREAKRLHSETVFGTTIYRCSLTWMTCQTGRFRNADVSHNGRATTQLYSTNP